jgi:type VI protein secretion system component Hcp
MDDPKTSLMMKFEADGGPVRAECPLVISASDALATKLIVMQANRLEVPGFRLITPNQLPRYFLISSFNFAAKLAGDESSKDSAGGSSSSKASAARSGRGQPGDTAHRHAPGGLGLGHRDDTKAKGKGKGKDGDDEDDDTGSDSFSLWRSAPDDSKKPPSKKPNNSDDQLYKSKIDSFSFTRLIDCSTSTLVKACCDGTSFKSASVIKRKPARSDPKSDPVDTAFIRIDFAGVKITSLSFSDGDIVTENCTFTCDAMQITYAQQDPSGKLTALAPVSWQNPVADTKGRANS